MHIHQFSLQQDHVIDEIECYGVPSCPEDKTTLAYLKAMRLLFERGFLCREHITTPDSAVLGRIMEEFSFLIDWCDDVIAHGIDLQDVNQSQFFAWQVNSHITISVHVQVGNFGFTGFLCRFHQLTMWCPLESMEESVWKIQIGCWW